MLRYFWTALLAVTLVTIFMLTEQTPQQTIALSDKANSAVEAVANRDAVSNSTAADDGARQDAQQTEQPVAFTLMGQGIRRLAHTAEFFFVGLFALLAADAWRVHAGVRLDGVRGRAVFLACVLAFCAAMSLFDQTHKLFVPGREFDGVDLVMDAVGYLLGIVLSSALLLAHRRFRGFVGASTPSR